MTDDTARLMAERDEWQWKANVAESALAEARGEVERLTRANLDALPIQKALADRLEATEAERDSACRTMDDLAQMVRTSTDERDAALAEVDTLRVSLTAYADAHRDLAAARGEVSGLRVDIPRLRRARDAARGEADGLRALLAEVNRCRLATMDRCDFCHANGEHESDCALAVAIAGHV